MTAGNKVTEFHSPHHKNSSSYSENVLLLLQPLSQLFELCFGRQQKADPPPCWLSSVYFRFLTAEPCSSMNFAGKWGKCSPVHTRNCKKTLEDISPWASRVGCAIYWTGQYLMGKIIVILIFFLRAAALPILELRFVSLTLRLKNMCKGENPTSEWFSWCWSSDLISNFPLEKTLGSRAWSQLNELVVLLDWCNSFWM